MSDRELNIKFAGRLIDLLGQQMYGGAVPAVAELVANAWDADAPRVEITIPADVTQADAEIMVQDFGEGMTFDELNEYYLNIGYERRKARGDTTKKGRRVMGRKGIGKLAGFGIAEDLVLRSVKDGHLVEFTLNYTTLHGLESMGGWTFTPDRDEDSDDPSGVTVIFKGLKLLQSINVENFKTSMARRFAIGAEEMEIAVNGDPITKNDAVLEYRFPESPGDWVEEEVKGFGIVKHWFGFQKTTIDDPELQGASIYARKRVAQMTPFFFNLTGGFDGQVGKEYLTGQVIAEPLDEDKDYVATDRQTVNWQFGNAPILEEWGKAKIKELCAIRKRATTKKKIDRFEDKIGEFTDRIKRLASAEERRGITDALAKVASIDRMTGDDFLLIASSMVAGAERESVKKVIRRINETSEEALPELYDAIKEWDVIIAVSTAEQIIGKIEIIKKFDALIKAKTPEKAKEGEIDMQTFIRDYPWLLGHKYETLTAADFHHEHGVDKWIQDAMLTVDDEKPWKRDDAKEGRRFDLLCLRNDGIIVILELMRPGIPLDYDHLMRLNRYIAKVSAASKSKSTSKEFEGTAVYGILIADSYEKDSSLRESIVELKHKIDVFTWNALFDLAQGRYQDILSILREKAPEDPRMAGVVYAGGSERDGLVAGIVETEKVGAAGDE